MVDYTYKFGEVAGYPLALVHHIGTGNVWRIKRLDGYVKQWCMG